MNNYIGHPSQVSGVTEMRLIGGKGDGMRMLSAYNGIGLDFDVSLDRCADITKLRYKGVNLSYIAPCGMVSPKYYDNKGAGFLKSFTAGFLTTCGLTAVGSPCTDDGEELPLHGTISHTPAEQISYTQDENYIKICAQIRDASLFAHQLMLTREYTLSLKENTLVLTDTVENIGCKPAPYMVLYHCNMGYPLVSEDSVLEIPSREVSPRDDHAAEDIDKWADINPPTNDFVEQCYYHKFDKNPDITLYNPKINIGMKLSFDLDELDCFTQWKMFGDNEYVLGLEPGNCYPDGRDVMRKSNILKFLQPGEKHTSHIQFDFFEK